MSDAPTIIWFRQDLRLADNPALLWARGQGPVIPLYIHDMPANSKWQPGGAGLWWLHYALEDLGASLARLKAKLILRQGDAPETLKQLVKQSGAKAVTWNRCYEPYALKRDDIIQKALEELGVTVTTHNAALLFEPWEMQTKTGNPYKVYTPFSRACFAASPPSAPQKAPAQLASVAGIATDTLASLKLLPIKPDWAAGFRATWKVGEKAAHEQLARFIEHSAPNYTTKRNEPNVDGTSRLSPYLHWGQIGPRQVWHAIRQTTQGGGLETYAREILWREFSYHLLYHFPTMPTAPLNGNFANFPNRNSPADLKAWQKGQTGYPIVDAGLRQLWQTGWMHNRVRMIVASFLVKHLLLPWQQGEAWFWDCLVDADLASNSASWQWVAGCGADAAPYFRIFNPTLQGTKFDPNGDYVRRFVPELAKLDAEFIHEPWNAPDEALAKAKIVLGKSYPKPMVEHGFARQRALAALKSARKT